MSIKLDGIGSGFNKAKIDANFKKVEQYLNSVVLSRANTGVPGEATMQRDLDLNSKRILNAFVGETPLSDLGEKVKIIEDFIKNGVALYEGMRSFETGNTLTRWNQALFWEASGTYFRWEGDFPKVVPAGSTPDTTGGIGNGKWIDIGNISTLEDSHHTKLLQIYFAELVTGRMGGTADGAKIDYTYDPDTGAMVETIPFQIEKAINDLRDAYALAWPFDQGNPVEAGLSSFLVPFQVDAIRTLTINGVTQYEGIHYKYDASTRTVTLLDGAVTLGGEVIVFHASLRGTDGVLPEAVQGFRFDKGATLYTEKDFIYDASTQTWWFWSGDFPKTVVAGESPYLDTQWSSVGLPSSLAESVSELLNKESGYVEVKSYHSGLQRGGGKFYFNATLSKTLHNGGTVIAKGAVFPTNWSDSVEVDLWFNPTLTGEGCWVRTETSYDIDVFGAFNDASTYIDSSINSIQRTIPTSGGIIEVPVGKYLLKDWLVLRAGVSLHGKGYTEPLLPTSLGFTPSISEIICEKNGITSPFGYSQIRDICITGYSGSSVGLMVVNPNVSTSNVSIRGFSDGVGFWCRELFRDVHLNLNIQRCGLGLYWERSINSSSFLNLTIENCAMGWISGGGTSVANVVTGTIEGNAKGKYSTIFPSTTLLAVPADILTDFAVTQDNVEGGAALVGTQCDIKVYFESNSLIHCYAGLDSIVNLSGSYFNDALALLGTNKVIPRNFVNAVRARTLIAEGIIVSTTLARTTAIFNINQNRFHRIGFNRYQVGAAAYTGVLYENTSGDFRISTFTELRDVNNNLLLSSSRVNAAQRITVTPVSGIASLDVSVNSVFFITLVDNTTITQVGTPVDGQSLELHVFQDGVGGRNLTFPVNFRAAWSNTGNISNKKCNIQFRYNSSDSRWHQVGTQTPYHD